MSGLVTEGTGSSLVQTTGEAAQSTATQPPLGVPGTNAVRDVSKSATRPVQGPGTSDVASSSVMSTGLVTEGTGSSLVQTTSEAAQSTATQPPLGVPGTNAVRDVSKSATQPLQAAGAEIATQPLQAPVAGQPPSLHRLPVQVLKCCQPVLILHS